MPLSHGTDGDPALAGGAQLAVLAVVAIAAATYVAAATLATSRGRPWPVDRTASYLGGSAAMAAATVLAGRPGPDTLWRHVAVHVLMMTVAPMLVARSAPVSLALRVLRVAAARGLVRVLRSRAVMIAGGHGSPWLLASEYYGVMFLLLLTPWLGMTEASPRVHVITHAYLVLCGLSFWSVVTGIDPMPWRPAGQVRRSMVLLGVPAGLGLGLAVMSRPPAIDDAILPGTSAGAALLAGAGVLTSIVSLSTTRPRQWWSRSWRDAPDGPASRRR